MKSARLFALILLCFTFGSQIFAQNPAKGLKALEDKDFVAAKKIFSDLLILDENDIAGNYGMSRLFSNSASGMKDIEKSLEHLLKAEEKLNGADSKTIEKINGIGITKAIVLDQRNSLERAFLEEAKKTGTVEAYDSFLARFPASAVQGSAANIRNTVAFTKAKALNTVEAFDEFCTKYPTAAEINEAKNIRNEMATKVALNTNSSEGYKNFLQKYPDAPQVSQIQQRLNATAFEDAKAANTVEAWESYVRNYPTSIFLNQAKDQLQYLRAGVDGE